MIKRIIRKVIFCIVCLPCLFIYCECHDDDEDHHHDHNDFDDFSAMWQDEQQKEYEARLVSENLPAFADSRNLTAAAESEKGSDRILLPTVALENEDGTGGPASAAFAEQ